MSDTIACNAETPESRSLQLSAISLVIFDCDGVLIDSERIASGSMSETLVEFGVDVTPHEALAIFTGNSERDSRAKCLELGVTEIDEFWRARSKRLYQGFEGLTEMAGISEAIAAINRPICVASNSSLFRLTRSLGRLPLWQTFKGQIFGADLVQRPKPAPDLLQLCASEMGAAPERAVMIDDSAHGIRAAIAAGMVPIGFVDPNDPRPERKAFLQKCGARFVAVGANEIRPCLQAADALLRLKANCSEIVAGRTAAIQ